jgi:hypothetical protein
MNQHDDIPTTVLYGRPSAEERARLDRHVQRCAVCRHELHQLEADRQALRMLGIEPPADLASRLFTAVTAQRTPIPRRTGAGRGLKLRAFGLLAIVLVVAAKLLLPRGTAMVSADTLLRQLAGPAPYLSPSSGLAYVSYRRLSSNDLPVEAGRYAASHLLRIRWAVRDVHHFRVDITTLRPAIDSGTFTVVVNGNHLRSYDSATGIAAARTLPRGLPANTLASYLVSLRFGGSCCSAIPDPSPMHSIDAYITALRRQPGIDRQGQSRLAGSTYFQGHRALIVDLTPVDWVVDEAPCWLTPGPAARQSINGDCPTKVRGYGRARLWIDQAHHALLKYQEFGFPRVQNPVRAPSHYLFRVRSIHFGPPSAAALTFRLPSPPQILAADTLPYPPAVLGGRSDFWIPPGMVRPAFPPGRFDSPGQQGLGLFGVHPRYFGLDIVWRHVVRFQSVPAAFQGEPTLVWYHGTSIFVQQRLRPGGLPAAFRTGRASRRGRCILWSGHYPSGALWAGAERGRLSVLISTDVLDREALRRYLLATACP